MSAYFGATNPDLVALIDAHIPSLTDKASAAIDAVVADPDPEWGTVDYADMAIRECRCGVMLDGFYEYAAHLKEVLRERL